MADVVWTPVAGVPFSGAIRYADSGDGTLAPLGMSIGGKLPFQSLSGASTLNTAGAALDNAGVRNNHSLVAVTSAGVSAGAVQLQGSQDGTNWFNLLSTPLTTNTASTVFGPLTSTATLTPVRFLRALISTAITGGTVSAWVASS